VAQFLRPISSRGPLPSLSHTRPPTGGAHLLGSSPTSSPLLPWPRGRWPPAPPPAVPPHLPHLPSSILTSNAQLSLGFTPLLNFLSVSPESIPPLIAFHRPASWPLKATTSPAGAPSPSLPSTRAEAEPCLALFLSSTPAHALILIHTLAPSPTKPQHPPPPR
jgi:hypothetical protein